MFLHTLPSNSYYAYDVGLENLAYTLSQKCSVGVEVGGSVHDSQGFPLHRNPSTSDLGYRAWHVCIVHHHIRIVSRLLVLVKRIVRPHASVFVETASWRPVYGWDDYVSTYSTYTYALSRLRVQSTPSMTSRCVRNLSVGWTHFRIGVGYHGQQKMETRHRCVQLRLILETLKGKTWAQGVTVHRHCHLYVGLPSLASPRLASPRLAL